jgi:predicted metal-dependent HD superfamily phosphohydrolase
MLQPEMPAKDPLLDAALSHHRQPHRAYHDERHVLELLELAAKHTPDLTETERLAIMFHDAVYVPGAPKGMNETLSALLMRATIAGLVRAGTIPAPPQQMVDEAAKIIEETTHIDPPSSSAARVCDLDLWRLAAPWEEFQQHSADIDREFRHLYPPGDACKLARKQFYHSMLARDHVFHTPYFRERFEPIARANFQRALNE